MAALEGVASLAWPHPLHQGIWGDLPGKTGGASPASPLPGKGPRARRKEEAQGGGGFGGRVKLFSAALLPPRWSLAGGPTGILIPGEEGPGWETCCLKLLGTLGLPPRGSSPPAGEGERAGGGEEAFWVLEGLGWAVLRNSGAAPPPQGGGAQSRYLRPCPSLLLSLPSRDVMLLSRGMMGES